MITKHYPTSSIPNLHLRILLGLFFIVGALSCTPKNEGPTVKLVVIHSFEENLVIYPELNKHIADYLQSKGINADIHTFYLDSDARLEPAENEFMYTLLDTMLVKPDLLLTTDDPASYAIMSCQHPLSRQLPIVFTGVNFPNRKLLKEFPNITGIHDKLAFAANIELIENIMGLGQVRIYYDRSFLGQRILAELRDQIGDRDSILCNSIEEYLKDPLKSRALKQSNPFNSDKTRSTTTEYTETQIRLLSIRDEYGGLVLGYLNGLFPNSVTLLTRYEYSTSRIGILSRTPTFAAINKEFGYGQGILGGHFTTVEDQAKEGCDYLIQIIKGRPVSSLPIKEAKKSSVLDWNEMQRWDIDRATVSNEIKIVNVPFYEQYKVALIIVSSLVGAVIIFTFVYLLFMLMRESKRKVLAQQSLREEKEFLSLVLEGGNIFAWSYNHTLETFTFDREFAVSIGLKKEQITLEEMITFTHPDDTENALTEFVKIVNNIEDKTTITVRLNFNNAGYTWYEFRMLSLPKRENSSIMVIGAILSIQDFKEHEQELILARDLAAKTELKQSFLANMSHEIRTPLNAIVGFSNILVADDSLGEEERKDFISTINTNCELLLKLINDILEISRIESGNLSFHFEECSVNKLIDDIYQMNCFLAPPAVSFVKETLTDDIIMHSDSTRLKQVLVNFVNNAFKFTSSGQIKVGVACAKERKEICLYVEDSGSGIPEEEQKMIFERFYKQDQFSQGTGLGLSISSVIAEKLNGRITLQSELGKGSTFGIILPCSVLNETHNNVEATYVTDQSAAVSPTDNRPIILIAEDSASNYMVLSRALKKHYTIVWALNGADALNIINTQPVDLVLLDIKMPEMDGITALKKIRKTRKDLPIIIQTAYAFEENRLQAKKAGCHEFIEKPIHTDTLLQLIGKYLPLDEQHPKG